MVARRLCCSALMVMFAAGCSRKAAPSRDSAAAAAAVASAAAPAAAAGGPLCARTGHWGECELRIRLEQSGLAPVVVKEKPGDLPTLAPTPVFFQIGNASMAAYFFADTVSRRKAAAGLDTSKFIPPSRAVGMHGEATAIESDNLLALLFSRNEHQRERVADAITAGAPQP